MVQELSDNEKEEEAKECLEKIRLYAYVLEEVNFKEKLTLRWILNLFLILLKQCKTRLNDNNLVQICETLIQPTLSATDD